MVSGDDDFSWQVEETMYLSSDEIRQVVAARSRDIGSQEVQELGVVPRDGRTGLLEGDGSAEEELSRRLRLLVELRITQVRFTVVELRLRQSLVR